VTNSSKSLWRNSNVKNVNIGGVFLSYHWLNNGRIVKDGIRTSFPKDLKPGENATVSMYVDAPEKKGAYILRISLLQEGYNWFYDIGGDFIDIPLKI